MLNALNPILYFVWSFIVKCRDRLKAVSLYVLVELD